MTTSPYPLTSLRHDHCRSCGHEIVLLPGTGWAYVYPGDTFDICPENDYGPHLPESDEVDPHP